MVTKQQQLEWLADKYESWPASDSYIVMSGNKLGLIGGHYYINCGCHYITKEEWQQERDKMQKQHDFDIGSNLKVSVAATSNGFGEMKINTLWYEREELPPVGVPVELWFGGTFAYNCEFIAMRGNTYVLWNLDADRPDTADYMNSDLRPPRTEREKAIDEMANLIAKSVFGSAKCQAEKLYDAGYRKVKP